MLLGPGLAVGALVFANDEEHDVCLARQLCRLTDAVRLRGGTNQLHIVLIPAAPSLLGGGDTATFGVEHRGFRTDTITDALQDAHPVAWVAAVATEMNVSGIRPDDGDGLDLL